MSEQKEKREESSLPSRSSTHRRAQKKNVRSKKKKKRNQIPLIQIWLLLFFTLVAGLLSYPVWIEWFRL
ncbi:hypothetical protein FLK61_30565 [Paenalkalicoccus suaedae]|uniref:Uncharacterized protein n=1 Tax=Paenalkalicoccus suaedae TaxID=2592382 RepID=A0A859FDX0_9BACI|nr:hypothetical protein [Paenalkalicoccus suaedae]QKS71061.1 hypothetical protein FLK61_30565 [Paenalkalicoccus suaedae]